MTSKGYILSRQGKAFYQDGDNWMVLESGQDTPRSMHQFDANSLSLIEDTRIVIPSDSALSDIQQQLYTESEKQEALTFALHLMDSTIKKIETKQLIVEVLIEDFSHSELISFVRNCILSTPVPKSFDPNLALSFLQEADAAPWKQIFEDLKVAQKAITPFIYQWNLTGSNYFETTENIDQAFTTLANKGIIADFVLAMAKSDLNLWNNSIVQASITLQLSNVLLFNELKDQIANDFPLEEVNKIQTISTVEEKDDIIVLLNNYIAQRQQEQKGKKKKTHHQKRNKQKSEDQITGEITKHQFEHIRNHVIFTTDLIVEDLRKQKPLSAKAHLKDIITNQLDSSSPDQICKSLSHIASHVLELNVDFTKTVLDYARMMNAYDPVLNSIEAELYRFRSEFEKAEYIYLNIVKNYPDDSVARSGLAETLKAQGKLEDAEKIYRNTIEQFPNNIIAKNGLAEILKAQGKFEDAEKIYKNTVEQFPDEYVPKSGLANILKAQGKYKEAEKKYKEAIKQFTDNIFVKTGLADTLKLQGKVLAAEKIYKDVVKQFPNEIVPKNGLAETLKAQGKFIKAENLYRETIQQFPNNDIAKNGLANLYLKRGEKELLKPLIRKIENPISEQDYYWHHFNINILMKDGQWEEAKEMLQYGIENCPFYKTLNLYQRTLKYVHIQLKDVEALKLSSNNFDVNDPVDSLLQAHSLAIIGNTSKAKEILEKSKSHLKIAYINDAVIKLRQRFEFGVKNPSNISIAELDEQLAEEELNCLLLAA